MIGNTFVEEFLLARRAQGTTCASFGLGGHACGGYAVEHLPLYRRTGGAKGFRDLEEAWRFRR